jgi:hypothetical protein
MSRPCGVLDAAVPPPFGEGTPNDPLAQVVVAIVMADGRKPKPGDGDGLTT